MLDLLAVQLREVFLCTSVLSAPWGIVLPAMPGSLMFHLPTTGSALVEVGEESHVVRRGEVVLVPHGTGHRIVSDPAAPATRLHDLPRQERGRHHERLRIDGGGKSGRLVCGAIHVDDLALQRVLQAMPPLLRLPAEHRSLVELVDAEARLDAPGSSMVTARLAEVLVIAAIRGWLEHSHPVDGWVGALHDSVTGPALTAFHGDLGGPWSVAALARTAGVSRSVFAERFRRVVGEAPMEFVTRWRMDHARRVLAADRSLPIATVARQVGYASEATFHHAFVRVHGRTPGSVRRA